MFKKFLMKNGFISLVCVLLVLLISFAGCRQQNAEEKAIKDLEAALNSTEGNPLTITKISWEGSKEDKVYVREKLDGKPDAHLKISFNVTEKTKLYRVIFSADNFGKGRWEWHKLDIPRTDMMGTPMRTATAYCDNKRLEWQEADYTTFVLLEPGKYTYDFYLDNTIEECKIERGAKLKVTFDYETQSGYKSIKGSFYTPQVDMVIK